MPVFDPRQNALRGEPYEYDEQEAQLPAAQAPVPPQSYNPFTPIRVPEKLGSEKRIVNRPFASLPPAPGQLYAYDVDRYDEGDTHAEGYRQAYVQMLRDVAPEEYMPPAYPPCPLPPMRPPVLYDDQADLGGYAPAPRQAAPEDAQAAFSAGSYTAETPYAAGGAYTSEYAPLEPPVEPTYRSQPVQQRPQTPQHIAQKQRRAPRSPLRAFLTALICLAIVACIVILASLVSSMQTARRENSQWREKYYEGGAATGSLVELPSGGATFAPVSATATPAPAPTDTPQPRIEIVDNLAGVDLSTPAPNASSRTARKAYQENPDLIISERFQALRQQNRDVVGWLTLGELDCPVLQHTGKAYYDTHGADGKYSQEGAIYIDPAVSLKTPPENLIVYGNNNPSGTMFWHLAKYETEGAAYLRRYPFIRLDTLYEGSAYVVLAVIRADTNPASASYFNFASYSAFPTDKAFSSYVAAARRRSLYALSVDAQVGDELLTLCTKSDSGASTMLVVLCRRLRAGESAETMTITVEEEQTP